MNNYSSKINKTKVLFHVMFWVLLMSLPLLLFSGGTIDYKDILKHNWSPIVVFAFLFYFNYLWLIDKFFYNDKKRYFILINVIIIIAFGAINFFVLDFSPPKHLEIPEFRGPRGNPLFFILKDILLALTPILISLTLKSSERNIRLERARKEVETRNLQTELEGLKYQLKPHFFFNSLNSIYSLIETSPIKAQEVVHALSKLMRYLLYETSKDKVLLTEDINFLKKYIELMEIRLSKNTTVNYAFQETSSQEIYPLLFLSLVENAFKHGVSSSVPTIINFKMNIIDNQLIFESRNTNLPKNEHDQSGSGIGSDNLRKRLELLYPSSHELEVKVIDGIYIATLSIILK